MLQYDQARIKEAVKYLVAAPYFKHHVRKLNSAVSRPRALPFRDDAEVLNELLIVGRQSLQSMNNLIELAEYKRDDRNTYQRKYMADKRKREAKVIAAQERLVRHPLSASERRKVLLAQYDIWNAQKEGHIAECVKIYVGQFGDEPGWEQRNQFIKDFWIVKDMELDQLMDEAVTLVAKVEAHRRKKRVVSITPPQPTRSPTQMSEQMKRALDMKV